jgi:hypothetical protein
MIIDRAEQKLIRERLEGLLEATRKVMTSIPERFSTYETGAKAQITRAHLVHVIAALVPGLMPREGWLKPDLPHAWLHPEQTPGYLIDPYPRDIYPGPVIVGIHDHSVLWDIYKSKLLEPVQHDDEFKAKVAEIVEATEGAKRFLGMP